MPLTRTYIPEFITVHLGRPQASARNVTVAFPDYIKNVASSEIYPTWPDSALRANIYAQTSFALNRYYTEWYPSQGYDFDITNSTAYDQFYVFGRDIFENISVLVDELFNDYLRRFGFSEPLLAMYCNGTTVTCPGGLSQWGSVDFANEGYVPYEILTYYYGENLEIVRNAPVQPHVPSFTAVLRRGSTGMNVRRIQIQLNRVSVNYPAIPKISPVDGVFGPQTEAAVMAFQRIFRLDVDGIVGKGTWYRLLYIYNSVKRLAEVDSEGETVLSIPAQFTGLLREGDAGDRVRLLQYFIFVISTAYQTVPFIQITGSFGPETAAAVQSFQMDQGIEATGEADYETWDRLYRAYQGILETIPQEFLENGMTAFPGYDLVMGMHGEDVRSLQNYLIGLRVAFPMIPALTATGTFGSQTKAAVAAVQRLAGLPQDGIVNQVTWDAILNAYDDLLTGSIPKFGQYPGNPLKEGDQDSQAAPPGATPL